MLKEINRTIVLATLWGCGLRGWLRQGLGGNRVRHRHSRRCRAGLHCGLRRRVLSQKAWSMLLACCCQCQMMPLQRAYEDENHEAAHQVLP